MWHCHVRAAIPFLLAARMSPRTSPMGEDNISYLARAADNTQSAYIPGDAGNLKVNPSALLRNETRLKKRLHIKFERQELSGPEANCLGHAPG